MEQDNIETIILNSKINIRKINGKKTLGIRGST